MSTTPFIFKEPWPEKGIGFYSHIDDGGWGYLILDEQGYRFDMSEQPTDEEILSRWRPYLIQQVKQEDIHG